MRNWGLIAGLIGILIFMSAANAQYPEPSDDYTIFLKSRQFTPDIGISNNTLNNFTALNLSRVHAIIQLYNLPTQRDIDDLSRYGARLFDFLPNYAWLAAL